MSDAAKTTRQWVQEIIDQACERFVDSSVNAPDVDDLCAAIGVLEADLHALREAQKERGKTCISYDEAGYFVITTGAGTKKASTVTLAPVDAIRFALFVPRVYRVGSPDRDE